MPFVELSRRDQGAPKAPVAMKLTRKKGGVFCSVTIRPSVLASLGWGKAEPLSVLMGDDVDAGKLMIEPAKARQPFAKLHLLRSTGVIHLGKIVAFGDRPTAEIPVTYDCGETARPGSLLIFLPDWRAAAVEEDEEDKEDEEDEPKVDAARSRPKPPPKPASDPAPAKAAPAAPTRPLEKDRIGVAAKPASLQSVGKDGVWVHFVPSPMIANGSETIELNDRQATWLAVLVPAIGKGVIPTDLIEQRSGATASLISADFRELLRPLASIKLRLAHQPKFGYALNKEG